MGVTRDTTPCRAGNPGNEENMRIRWARTSVGGYVTKGLGGWFTGRTGAMITPSECECEWYLAMVLNNKHVFEVHSSVASAKRTAARKIKKAIC